MTEEKKKILCIEDDRETAALITEELVERGYKAIVAYDGREGLNTILTEMPDLVLCDISMRNMSGFEVLSHLIKIAPGFAKMPFVFLTGLTDRHSRLRGRQLGVDDYVIKPIDFDVLGTIIVARLARVARTGPSTRELQLNNREVDTPSRANAQLRSASLLGR
jgi:DNA-binding response OmpR family regulator